MSEETYFAAMRLAENAVERHSYTVALRHFEDALSEFPDSADAHARLSICLTYMNRRFGALEEAEKALRLDPELPLAHVAFGHAALLTGDVKAARGAARRVSELEPESEDAATLRCVIAYGTREHRVLEESAKELLALDPENVFGLCMLSRAHAMTGKGAEAELIARDALALDPENAMAHEAIGWAFFAQGRFRQARDAALSALSLGPGNEAALMLLASASLRRRWLTGWLFWPALWIMRNSERAFMTAFIVGNAVLLTVANVLWRQGQKDLVHYLDIGSWVLTISLLASFAMLTLMLRNETRNVRLTRQY